jgi:hypothetical protein
VPPIDVSSASQATDISAIETLVSMLDSNTPYGCYVCGGIEDEDLIILCDASKCRREVHMYCLWPVPSNRENSVGKEDILD